MNRVPIDRLHELFTITEQGGLTRIASGRGNAVGTLDTTGYLKTQVDGVRLRVHRVVFAMSNGVWPDGEVDHIDGNRLNNRPENLRVVSRSENAMNQRRARADNQSGLLGVTFNAGAWAARISAAGKVRYLGRYPSPESAHMAYLAAKREIHSTCSI